MRHPNGIGRFLLACIDGGNSSPDDFGHICPGVYGNNQNARKNRIHIDPQHLKRAIVDDHGLHHHGRTPEHLDINIENRPKQAQKRLFEKGVCLTDGNRAQNRHQKADKKADKRAQQRDFQRIEQAAHK